MASLVQISPSATEVQLCGTFSSLRLRSSSTKSHHNRPPMRVKLGPVSFLCFTQRALGCRVKQKPSPPKCAVQSVSALLSADLTFRQDYAGVAAKEHRICGGRGLFSATFSSWPGDSSHPTSRGIPITGFRGKSKKGVRRVGRSRTKLEERLQRGFRKFGLERQFGELPQWSAYVPLVAGGLELLVIVGWTVHLKGDLRGSSMFNFSGEGLLTLLLGTNFAVGWLASHMSTWRVANLSPSLLGRGKKAVSPRVLDFIGSFFVNVIPYGNFLAWTRFAWKESSSVSSFNALVYVMPSVLRLVLWSQGLTIGRVEVLAWVLGAIHRPYDAARVENEKLLAAANAKLAAVRKAKEEKDQLKESPELTVDEMAMLQQRKELEEFDILLAKSAKSTTSIPGPTQDWSIGDTVSWLAQEGFARYASTFADNDVDGAILLLLTENDLRDELGIQSLGDRKKLSQAIQRLR